MDHDEYPPHVIVMAGPNGAGKTTSAARLLPAIFNIKHYVNADAIASGLSAFDPESAAFAAGRLMLERIEELARAGESFAFESTLASRTFTLTLRRFKAAGYTVHLVFVSLPDPELSVARVAGRVQRGGHSVPPDTIRRRFQRGLANFFSLYTPIADSWYLYDNSGATLVLVGSRRAGEPEKIVLPEQWSLLRTRAGVQ